MSDNSKTVITVTTVITIEDELDYNSSDAIGHDALNASKDMGISLSNKINEEALIESDVNIAIKEEGCGTYEYSTWDD